jgi:hypothetical protein
LKLAQRKSGKIGDLKEFASFKGKGRHDQRAGQTKGQ